MPGVLAIGACAGLAPVAHAQLSSRACRVPGIQEDVRCATVEVPENRATPNGRSIDLRVVVLPARAEAGAQRRALIYLVGGPGLAATTLADLVAASHAATRATHDVVLVDQRGTGGSNALDCPLYGDTSEVTTYLGDQFPVEPVRACGRRLASLADLSMYTTSQAAEDLDEVRRSIGVDQVDIDASAYGTRVAMAYARRYSDRVRSMVLQGVVPEDQVLAFTAARDAQRALEQVFADCAADPFCRTSFPALRREMAALLARFGDSAITLRVRHPRTTDTVRVALRRGVFADRLRIMLYSTRLSRRIPIVLHRAYEGDWTPFVTLAYELSRTVFDALDAGAHLAAACAEDVSGSLDVRGTFLGDYRARMYRDGCAAWGRYATPRTRSTDGIRVPTLLITGAVDPVTPPRFAEAVARGMPNATVLIVPGMAHAGSDGCVEGVVAAFIAAGSMRGVDSSCVVGIRAPAFITR
ncbi:MAG: alpha/beta hydrolase [Gemmatimonadaceae bacterium]